MCMEVGGKYQGARPKTHFVCASNDRARPFEIAGDFPARGSSLCTSRGFWYTRLRVCRFSTSEAETGPIVHPDHAFFLLRFVSLRD